MSGLRDEAIVLARRGLFEGKTLIARYPSLALPIARRRHGEPLQADTEIAIEGFPRTGTSFVVAAFRLAQPRPVMVACHVHAPAQLIGAARRALPALAIVRAPEDTALSFVVRNPHLSVRQALHGYLRFYEPLVPILGQLAVGTFEQVTRDVGEITRRVNERFGTAFVPFEPTEEHVAEVFRQIDADYRRRSEGEDFERAVARPSAWREEEKARLRASYATADLRPLRRRAERVYRRFADVAGA
jgi:hypothetical protein